MKLLQFLRRVLLVAALSSSLAAQAGVGLKTVAEGFVAPILVDSLPGVKSALLVGDQVGVVYVVKPDGSRDPKPFLDLREHLTQLRNNFDERGLLGLAFHPQAEANGRFYVCYSAPLRAGVPTNWNHTMHIAEFHFKPGNRAADPASHRVVLQIDKPSFNHNGGRIAFGPDGFLYIGVGDGGEGNDKGIGHAPEGNGQNKDTLLGKILRIDVDRKEAGREYAIPGDNPFARGGGRPEIFAVGIRNPWGLSFDRGGKRELFAADVGQNMWEEVNIIRRGGNYGWRLRESLAGFDVENPMREPDEIPRKAADGSPLIDPAITYMNAKGHPTEPGLKGTSVTGGYVYRGAAIPELKGRYVFGDWTRNWGVGNGLLFVATPPAGGSGPWKLEALDARDEAGQPLKGYVWAFGEDASGEIYVATSQRNGLNGTSGRVLKFVPVNP